MGDGEQTRMGLRDGGMKVGKMPVRLPIGTRRSGAVTLTLPSALRRNRCS